jgi:hypothetical protein
MQQVNVLPPLFEDRDNTAALLSLILPGGGFFYKGQRSAGWAAFLCEAAAGFYAAENFHDESKFNTALIAAAAVKTVSVIASYFTSPGYEIYNTETAGTAGPSVGFAFTPQDYNNGAVYSVSLNFLF